MAPMKRIPLLALSAAALCAAADPAADPAAPDLTLRVKSLDAVREAVTAASTLAGQPQAGLMATMGLSMMLGQAGLSGIRPADPAYVWLWDAEGLAKAVTDAGSDDDYEPTILLALPVADPSRELLDEAFERLDAGDADAPPVWTDGDGLFATVRDGWTLSASSTGLFDRAAALLALPPAMPDATVSVSSAPGFGIVLARFSDAMRDGNADGLFDAAVRDGFPEELASALAAFGRELNAERVARAGEVDSFRAGVRCDLTNGIVFALSLAARPGTKSAERIAAMKTPVDPGVWAAIPADAFLWGATGDATEARPDEIDPGIFFALARKHLLALVPGDDRRARAGAVLDAISAAAPDQKASSFFVGTDAEGRLRAEARGTVVSPDRTLALDRAAAAFLRAELAACSNAALAAAFDVPEDGLRIRVRTRALADAATDLVLEDGDVDEEDRPYLKRAVGAVAVAFLGEDFGTDTSFRENAFSTVVGAAGAERSAAGPLAPDFSADALFFPGQTRTTVVGIDLPGAAIAFGETARKAARAVKEIARENAEATGQEFKEENLADLFGTIENMVLPKTGSPILAVYGTKDGELTETFAVSPAFLQNVKAFADIVSDSVDDAVGDEDLWDEDEDESGDLDDDAFDDDF